MNWMRKEDGCFLNQIIGQEIRKKDQGTAFVKFDIGSAPASMPPPFFAPSMSLCPKVYLMGWRLSVVKGGV